MAIDIRTPPTGSPEWYLIRLLGRLEERRPTLERLDRYYHGNQPLAFFSEDFREAFGGRFHRFSSNFMALVVDGTRERLEVEGFRFRDAAGDDDLWAIWQENDLDGASQIAHTEALIKGVAYVMVEPHADGGTPRVTIEDALDCIVETDPRDSRRRLAGLKRWIADDGRMVVYVYLPDAIYKYRSVAKWPDRDMWTLTALNGDPMIPAGGFEMLESDIEPWPLPNPLGRVPIVALPNRPRLKVEGQSEIAPVASNQDV
ncbi:MAG: phage portal protein, partial [Chloroflexi bacterium]|nr:phage portal protein [Chloroflexota bacterium]